ncbi:hypothetical protein AGR1B_Lc60178 [Agrobacterium fabacearum S56]|nr:hypothetical protein AGR1B_Lc60178 [Agrobacterium fabacearum S56]
MISTFHGNEQRFSSSNTFPNIGYSYSIYFIKHAASSYLERLLIEVSQCSHWEKSNVDQLARMFSHSSPVVPRQL